MRALTVTGIEKLELVEIEKPQPGENEVLIKVAYVGVCGSDLPRYFEGAVHNFPQVLGHEFSGIIEKTGSNVELQAGDRVAVAPLIPCNECEQCMSGRPQLCTQYSFIGSRQQGAMAEYVIAPEANCLVIPEELDLKIAATIEPLTVAIHGIERVKIKSGDRALVLGAGTIGLMTILALRAKGVGEIIVVDLNAKKLELAKKIGADSVINPIECDIEEYFSNNKLVDVVFETAGSAATQVQAVKYAGRQGKVVYIGTCTREVTFSPEDFELILRRELEITGSWMSYSGPFPGFEWRAALEYLSKGIVDTNLLITGVYSLEDKEIPFDKMKEVNSEEVKVLYEVGGEI